ncbi:MAG: hypothetical protein AB1589_39795 [Cyanobacteriota bacterium]
MTDIKSLSPTCKPMGFWLSVRETHSAHLTLTELENQFGSYFENLTRHELHALLTYCAAKSDSAGSWLIEDDGGLSDQTLKALDLIDKLDSSFQLGLGRFLLEILYTRGSQK